MSDIAQNLKTKHLLALWSDRVQAQATKFADDHRALLPRRISNAQLYGLWNVVRAARRFSAIKTFVDHQIEKASRRGQSDVQDYWNSLGKEFDQLGGEASELLKQLSLPLEPERRATADELHCDLIKLFVQAFVAQSVYWTPASARE